MGGLKKTIKRFANASMGKGYMTTKERREKKAIRKQDTLDKIYAGGQIPDEEEIARNERRKAAKRRGSRVSNVLTDDTLG